MKRIYLVIISLFLVGCQTSRDALFSPDEREIEEIKTIAADAVISERPHLSEADLLLSRFTYRLHSIRIDGNGLLTKKQLRESDKFLLDYDIVSTATIAKNDRIPEQYNGLRARVEINNQTRHAKISYISFGGMGPIKDKDLFPDAHILSEKEEKEISKAVIEHYILRFNRHRNDRDFYISVYDRDPSVELMDELIAEGHKVYPASSFMEGSGTKFRLRHIVILKNGDALVPLDSHSGSLSGGGRYVWLTRIEGKWTVFDQDAVWVS